MRVIECNQCGEVLQADTEDQLVEVMVRHMDAEHADAGVGKEQVKEIVARDAYEATDA